MNDQILKYALENRHSFVNEINAVNVDKENRIIPMTFAKEYPVAKWWGVLSLKFGKKNVRLDRWKQKQGVPFLNNHLPNDQRGIILNGELKDGVLQGDVKFSRNASGEELMLDVVDGIRPYSSVGFDIHRMIEMDEKEMTDEIKSLVIQTGLTAYAVEDWEPLEGSSVWMGENPAVGAFGYDFYDLKDKKEVITLAREFNLPINIDNKINNSITKTRSNKMTPEEIKAQQEADDKVAIKLKKDREAAEKSRKDQITKLATDYKDKVKNLNLDEIRDLHINGNMSVQEFSKVISDNVVNQVKKAASKPSVFLGRKDIEGYSLSRAISSLLNGENCLEMEISAEYAKLSERKIEGGGKNAASFFLPHSVIGFAQRRGSFNGDRRMTKFATDVNTTATTGGEFVGTDHLGGEWIDVLLNELVLTQLGVVFLPGRKGNIEIPKLSQGNTFGWAATENAAVVEGDPATTEVTLTPKRGGCFVDVSKTAIVQSDPALDVVLTQNGRAIMVRGFEAGALHGSGASGQIAGVENFSSVNNSSLASATWQNMLDTIKQIKAANAAIGDLKFCINSTGEAILRGRAKESGYPVYIMSDDGRIAGRMAPITEAVNAGYLFLGAWSQAYMAFWDALDVTVDPYTLATTHQVRITFNQLADFASRYDESFYYASDLD